MPLKIKESKAIKDGYIVEGNKGDCLKFLVDFQSTKPKECARNLVSDMEYGIKLKASLDMCEKASYDQSAPKMVRHVAIVEFLHARIHLNVALSYLEDYIEDDDDLRRVLKVLMGRSAFDTSSMPTS